MQHAYRVGPVYRAGLLSTAVAYFSKDGHAWNQVEVLGLLPVMIGSCVLAVIAARMINILNGLVVTLEG